MAHIWCGPCDNGLSFFACWVIFLAADCFSQLTFFIVSNGLDPDQDQCCVGPDLIPNCLQTLSVDDKSLLARKELNHI